MKADENFVSRGQCSEILIYYQINTKYTFYMLYQYLYKLRYWRLLNKFSYSE